VISKLCNLSGVSFVSEKQEGAVSFMVRTTEYFIPVSGILDVEGEIAKIQEDLTYNRGFLVTVMKKLENERFVQNAPATVLELERKKKSDAESKIKSLEERIKELGKL
jgi:valyl-tRNA synthetase